MEKRITPKEFVEKKNRRAESSLFSFHQDKMILVSYAPKPRKSVILRSSQHNNAEVVREAKNKHLTAHAEGYLDGRWLFFSTWCI